MDFPCFLDENYIYVSVFALFNKGNPLLIQFNTLFRRVLEAGIASRYWEQLNHEALLTH